MSVKITGLDKVIKKYEEHSNPNEFQKRIDKFMDLIAQVGIKASKLLLGSGGALANDGNADVTILEVPRKIANGVEIIATGHDCLFVEFGYGFPAQYDPHEKATEYGNDFVAGSWSDNESLGGKHQWRNANGWYYKHDAKSYGFEPQRYMFYGSIYAQERLPEIAREVFGSD